MLRNCRTIHDLYNIYTNYRINNFVIIIESNCNLSNIQVQLKTNRPKMDKLEFKNKTNQSHFD